MLLLFICIILATVRITINCLFSSVKTVNKTKPDGEYHRIKTQKQETPPNPIMKPLFEQLNNRSI